MNIKYWILILGSFIYSTHSNSQNDVTISGIITDVKTGENLIGAYVIFLNKEMGTTSNQYGFYSITLTSVDSLGLGFSFIGYKTQLKKVFPKGDIMLNIQLKPNTHTLDEVVVLSSDNDFNVSKTQMGVIDISTSKIKELPAILGEVDVLKILTLLPGVQAGNEGTTGYHVRGGNADQNLVQLDEAIVYNPNHIFGLFSSFNARAINHVTLIKGGFPAQYGGRLSSILDITMKEGNNKNFRAEGGIGLITSQLTLEGPIKKDVASFIVSGRRTYFDYLIKPFLPKAVTTNYSFYDLNTKVNWKIDNHNRIYLSYFKGNDDAYYSKDNIKYNILFGNETATLRWNHIYGSKLFSNVSFIINNYQQDISALQDNAFSQVVSGISDINGKIEFDYYTNTHQTINFGAHYLNHKFKSSGDATVHSANLSSPVINVDSIPTKRFSEISLYVNDEIKITDYLSTSIGLRIPGFLSKEVSYYRIEPRISIQTKLHSTTSIKASYSMMNQFIHLVPSSTAAIPTDIWVPSSKNTKPQVSQQFAIGLFKNFSQNKIESSIEFYYKTMGNQVLFREGNQLIKSLDVDDLLVHGKGWSYGAEFYLNKRFGKLTGWASYTLSWTFQEFEELNLGKSFPFRYDRRHNLALVGTYQINEKWKLSGSFVYYTGSAFTVPVGRITVVNGGSLFEGNYYIYGDRNNARLNSYHKLDLTATYKKEGTFYNKKIISEWVFGLYNTYSRQNPYFIYFDIDPVGEKPRAIQVSLLPIIPSITYNFKI